MDKSSMTLPVVNATGTGENLCHLPANITATNVVTTSLILASFLVGTAVNGFFLWVLVAKMKRTVTTTWFRHLTASYLIFCFLLPFLAVYDGLGFCWPFGREFCKISMFLFGLGMFATVFLLTVISLDRYLFTCRPAWAQQNRTVSRAWKVSVGVWLVSIALSSPYLASSEIRELKGGTNCYNNITWETARIPFFVVWFLLSFLFPFLIIVACYGLMSQEMKKKKLVRTGKPFKILAAAVGSFFMCWFPHHLYFGLVLFKGVPEMVINILWILMAIGACFNICFTPLLYLFIGEKFQQVFKTSVLTLLKRGFTESPITPGDSSSANEEGRLPGETANTVPSVALP